jgi:hypothetical protein
MRPLIPGVVAFCGIVLIGRRRDRLAELHRLAVQQIHVTRLAAADDEIGSRNRQRAACAEIRVIFRHGVGVGGNEKGWDQGRSSGRQLDEAVAELVVGQIRFPVSAQKVDGAVAIGRQTTAALPDSGCIIGVIG